MYYGDSTDPVNPVNSCIFAAVLYFPVFCAVFSCVYSFIHEVWSAFKLRDVDKLRQRLIDRQTPSDGH